MAIVAVSISPIGEGVSVGRFVLETQKVLRRHPELRYRLDPMFTTIEGDLDDIFRVIREMQEAVFAAGAQRVSTVMKIDDRRDKSVHMEDKVQSIEKQLADDKNAFS